MDDSRELNQRKRRLVRWIKDNDLDAAVFSKAEIESFNGNYLYYGGGSISGEYGAVMIESTGECSAVVQEHAFERVRASKKCASVYETRQSTVEFARNLKLLIESRCPAGKVALDPGSSAFSFLELAKDQNEARTNPSLREFVFLERSVKSDYEITEMESAIKIARLALEKTIDALASGMKIEAITRVLNCAMVEEGAIGTSFETDIRIRRDLADEESVNILHRGDLVLFDFGARLPSMYLSDVGRTIPFGRSTKKQNDFLEDVLSIKREGIKRISSGKSGRKVREEIDSLIGEHGYVSTHRPGHQIGLNVHEPYGPNLNYGEENSRKLEDGNVVTWEPGIGMGSRGTKIRFGLSHMEDMVLVSPRGMSKALGNLDLKYW